MKYIAHYISPNYDARDITVEFLVLHYSACSLAGLFKIFADPQAQVSSHFAISHDGAIYEIVPCLGERVYRAWHAGRSIWENGRVWEHFNDLSIGIELINYNGNIFDYPAPQMEALKALVHELKERFPALRDPHRLLGHEQIAGFRGKADPGARFDWKDVFRSCYPGCPPPQRQAILPPDFADSLESYLEESALKASADDLFWQKLNTQLESSLASGATKPTEIFAHVPSR
jgi:N-acetyl-anhydromuramyl-L-alanine amidase AmpD